MKILLFIILTFGNVFGKDLPLKRIGQMKSRFCAKFNYYKPIYVHRSLPPNRIENSLNFSVEFWQPFISLTNIRKNSSTLVCGPLLGFLIELANKINFNLTYYPDLGNDSLPYDVFDEYNVNLVLTPYPPMNSFDDRVQRYIHLSKIFGDVPMISILSAEMDSSIKFAALSSFNDIFIYWYLFFCASIAVISFVKNVLQKKPLRILLLNYIRCILKQPLPHFDDKSERPLQMNVIWLTFFLNLFLSNLLLTFYQFRPPSDKIDTFQDLARHSQMKIFLFKGETSETILANDENPFYHRFKDRFLLEDPKNEEMEDWHRVMAEKIFQQELAIISDKYYLDFFYNSFIKSYPNLYRSNMNGVILPYFLPLRNTNSDILDRSINQMISVLFESGIYKFWLFETLYQNSLEEERGTLERTKENYDETPDILNNELDDFNVAPLTMEEMASIFYILILSSFIAMFILVFEIIGWIILFQSTRVSNLKTL